MVWKIPKPLFKNANCKKVTLKDQERSILLLAGRGVEKKTSKPLGSNGKGKEVTGKPIFQNNNKHYLVEKIYTDKSVTYSKTKEKVVTEE